MSYVFMIHSGYCGAGGSRYITDGAEYQSEDDAFEAGQEAYSVVCQRWIASEGIPRPSDDAGDDDPWYVANDDLMSDDCNGFTVFPLYGTEGVDEFSGRGKLNDIFNACYLETTSVEDEIDDLAIAEELAIARAKLKIALKALELAQQAKTAQDVDKILLETVIGGNSLVLPSGY